MTDPSTGKLLERAEQVLGLSFVKEKAAFLGISVRTLQRRAGSAGFQPDDYPKLLQALYPRDPATAEALAQVLGLSLDALGLSPGAFEDLAGRERGAALPEHALRVLVAAADAFDLVPRDARPRLARLCREMLALEVDLNALAQLLAVDENSP